MAFVHIASARPLSTEFDFCLCRPWWHFVYQVWLLFVLHRLRFFQPSLAFFCLILGDIFVYKVCLLVVAPQLGLFLRSLPFICADLGDIFVNQVWLLIVPPWLRYAYKAWLLFVSALVTQAFVCRAWVLFV